MRIGIAGPVTLSLLSPHLNDQPDLGDGYAFAPMARWVLGLRDRGHHVSVFTLSPTAQRMESYDGHQLTVHIAPYRPTGRAKNAFRDERLSLQAMMTAYPQDVLHAHWTYEFALAALATKQPVVVTAHDSPLDVLRLHPSAYRLVRAGMAAKAIIKAPSLTAVSPYLADRLRSTFRRQNLRIIPNGVPDEVFELQAARPGRDTELTFASSMMGFTGLKNGATLLRAFGKVRQQLPHTRLMMFGDGFGPQAEAYEYAREHGLTEGIEFVGRVGYDTLLSRLSQEADILVHPSLEESFGMAVAEAMGLGLPVIAGDKAGALPWITNGGQAAVLVDVVQDEILAAAMLDLVRSPERRDQLSTSARLHIQNNFSLHRQLTDYEQEYAAAINRQQMHK
ncbi:glycosyltransferase family 4 protein [Deinococcus oregonensis]|uniref:Glycosyltransferase family 4 protein n=1 Tax=Deinococcus oregonensis TaxID=1805970 RepID=A0ABV6B5J8_9DEIO